MRLANLRDMVNGWFVGDFTPAVHRTPAAEVAFHEYRTGQMGEPHVHRIATEVNLVVSGEMVINGVTVTAGDIFTIEPGEVAEARFIQDTQLVIVKVPSVPGDKYPVENKT